MTPDLTGTDCVECEHRTELECRASDPLRLLTRPLGPWLHYRGLIPAGVERPRAPGWCSLRAHEQLPLWRRKGAA